MNQARSLAFIAIPTILILAIGYLVFNLKNELKQLSDLQKQTELSKPEAYYEPVIPQKSLNLTKEEAKKLRKYIILNRDELALKKDQIGLKRDLITLEKDINGAFIQTLSSVAVLAGIFFAWQNLRVSQTGQITERFTKAIDQIGDTKVELRLGGIYALERIAKDSMEDYWVIIDVLTSFIQERTIPVEDRNDTTQAKQNKKEETKLIAKDIQAALTAIGRLNRTINKDDNRRVHLSNTYLMRAYLPEANLMGVNLMGANLMGANLMRVNLMGANLCFANFTGVNLQKAKLQNSILNATDLKNAKLDEANLENAKLNFLVEENGILVKGNNFLKTYKAGDNLLKANFVTEDFNENDLNEKKNNKIIYKVDLSESRFRKAILKKADLRGSILTKADLRGSILTKADFRGADLGEADLTDADLREANFTFAKNLTSQQIKTAKNWRQAKYDPHLCKQLGIESRYV